MANDAEKITKLIENGADPNETASNGSTLLHGAAGWDNAEAIKALICVGTDVNKGNPQAFFSGETPLHYAAYENRLNATLALIQGRANLSALAGNRLTPLHCASLSRSADVAEALLEAGADANARTGTGKTPLHIAAIETSVTTAGILLDGGADPDARDEDGQTPLHCTLDSEVSWLLIRAGADTHAQDRDGRKPDVQAIGPAPHPNPLISLCPQREDYVDRNSFRSALENFFAGKTATLEGMTKKAKATRSGVRHGTYWD